MRNTDIVQVVADKIDAENYFADKIVASLKKEKYSFTSPTVREFFPEHEAQWGINRTNLVPDVSIASQVIYGSPVTIDLFPETIAQFEKRYNIDYRAALFLAEEGWIFPSLYVQNPEDWHGYPELAEIVKMSTGNGIRINKYLSNRFPKFDMIRSSKTEEAESFLKELYTRNPAGHNSICQQLCASEESAARVLGNRWAYLECFAQDSSATFRHLLYSDDYEIAIVYLEVLQNLTVSPLSGALGGHLTWSFGALEKLKKILTSDLRYRSNVTLGVAAWQYSEKNQLSEADKSVNNFLLQQITDAAPYEHLEFTGAKKISSITRKKEFKQLKIELHDVMTKIASKSNEGIEDIEINTWISLTKDVKRHVSHFNNIGAIASTGASVALGLLSSHWLIAVGSPVVGFIDLKTNLFGSGISKLLNTNHHRFNVLLSKLKKLS